MQPQLLLKAAVSQEKAFVKAAGLGKHSPKTFGILCLLWHCISGPAYTHPDSVRPSTKGRSHSLTSLFLRLDLY